MSQQKQFEGPDIRALLDEIRTAYGAEPTIARAETFRTGGVLGFFQREHYRLFVEDEPAPDGTGATDLPVPGNAGRSERPVERPHGLHYAGARKGPAIAAPAPLAGRERARALYTAAGSSPAVLTVPGGRSPGADLLTGIAIEDHLAFLADGTEDTFVATGSAPSVAATKLADRDASTGADRKAATTPPTPTPVPNATATEEDEPSFESVLRRVAAMVEAPVAVPMVWPSLADVEPLPDIEPPGHALPPGDVRSPGDIRSPSDLRPPVDPPDRPEPLLDFRLPPPPPPPPAALTPEPATTPPADLSGAGDDAPAAGRAPDQGQVCGERRLALQRGGFDPESVDTIVAAASAQDLESAVLGFFDSLPSPPRVPDRNGSLVVVVGAGPRVGIEAARLAAETGSDPAGVAHARPPHPAGGPGSGTESELVIRSVDDAHQVAPGHRRGRVGLVAVDAPVGSPDAVWARQVIHALRPTFVVGVVDAMHKTEDIDAWVDALGGLDSLVVDNIDATVSPARILELAVPVGRLGQHPATAARWAATILDRVAPDGAAPDDAGTAGDPGRTVRRHG